MLESRKFVIRQTLLVLAGVMVCVAAMVGVYALLDRFGAPVVLGGIIGGVLATANFFFMAVSAELAADKAESGNVQAGQTLMRSSYIIRLVAMFAILFVCARSGKFDTLALVLPLVFVRPVLSMIEFFRKSGEAKV